MSALAWFLLGLWVGGVVGFFAHYWCAYVSAADDQLEERGKDEESKGDD